MTTLQDLLIYKSIAGEGGGSQITVEPLNATDNGIYDAGSGKAYNPVSVDVPEPTLISKSITANGTYNASSDNADGYSSVTVNVPDTAQALIDKSISGTVTIPSGTTTLRQYILNGCSSITDIVFPNTLTTIEQYACRSCTSLEAIDLNEGLTSIGNYAFNSCKGATSLILPSTLTSIGNSSFCACVNIENDIVIPNTVTTIGQGAFQSFEKVKKVKIPPIATIQPTTFSGFRAATEIDCTEFTVTNGNADTALSNVNAFNLTNNAPFIFATQAIMEVYAQATNWSTYASRMTYVGA